MLSYQDEHGRRLCCKPKKFVFGNDEAFGKPVIGCSFSSGL